MAANVDLWMKFNDVYHHALSIPVDTCHRFSVHPLTWLRYLAFTIHGNEGHISALPDGPEVSYFERDNIQGVYYYIAQEACLLDPDLMNERTSDSSESAISTSRRKFRQDVTARDGTCVVTGTREGFRACHIIPHAKGHQYMINLAEHRHEAFDPPLNDINDIRNGILLALQLHDAFGASRVAFLQTPNFAMTVNDVDLVMQPSAAQVGFVTQPSIADKRLTFQHFNTHDLVVQMMAPHNSDARRSVGHEWPPPLIFDVAYGCAALKTWGVAAFIVLARNHTEDIYYDDGHGGGGGGSGGCGSGGRGGRGNHGGRRRGDGKPDNSRSQQKRDRDARAANRQTKFRQKASDIARSQSPDFADMILGLWMRNARKGQHKARAMKADRTQEKVQTWLESAE